MALQPYTMQGNFFDRLGQLFTFRRTHHFAPNQVLSETPEVDPLLVPRVPMNSERIDPALMLQFRAMGFTHAQEITEETHPEFYIGWVELCRRAGFMRPLQLIVTSSKDPNAIDASENEVVLSTGLIKMLSARELLGVLGHELGHAKHDATNSSRAWMEIGGALGGAVIGSQAGKVAQQRWLGGRSGFFTGVLGEIGQFISMVGLGTLGWMGAKQFSVKPSELRADREGALLSGDPDGLISAFEKMGAMSSKQPTWKQFLRYAWSGYPTFDARISQLRAIKEQLPAGQTPVYQMVELLAQTPALAQFPGGPLARVRETPEPQVRGVADAERVVFVPEKTQMH